MTTSNLPTRDSDGKLPAFAWPGGYPFVYYFADGGVCCPRCANGENGSSASEAEDEDAQWRLIGGELYFEGEALECSHCAVRIESAYGDPDGDDTLTLEERDARQEG